MKWIKIKNKGMIQPEALHLMGGTTKTNDSTKIGQFGSGNKYALAYLLRNGYSVKIFSGLEEIKIETKSIDFRNNDFEVIYINGERTSITTKMGKDWEFFGRFPRFCLGITRPMAGGRKNSVRLTQPKTESDGPRLNSRSGGAWLPT